MEMQGEKGLVLAEEQVKTLDSDSSRPWSFSVNWLILLILALINILVLNYFAVDWQDFLRFVPVLVIFTLFPGLLVVNLLNVGTNGFYKFYLGMITGIPLGIFLYILCSIFQLKALLYFLFPLLALIYLGKYGRQDARLLWFAINNIAARTLALGAVFSLLLLLITAVIYFYPNPLPETVEAAIYYVDHPWHLGNIGEIKNHWYPQDPRLAGHNFHYHVFFYVYAALLASVSGILTSTLYFRLLPWFLISLFLLAAYYTGSRWYKKYPCGFLFAGIMIFLGSCFCSYPFNILLKNYFISPTFLFGALFFLPLLLHIKEYLEGKPFSLFLCLIFIFAISGAKGSIFPVLLGGLAGCWLYDLLKRNYDAKLPVLIFSGSAVFLAIFLYLYQGTGSEGINIEPWSIVVTTQLFAWWQTLPVPGSSSLSFLLFLPLYFAAFLAFRLPVLLVFLKDLLWQKRLALARVFLGMTALAGFLPGYLLNYRGSSQYYFLFFGLICLNMLAAGYLWEVFQQGRGGRLWQGLLLALIICCLADTYYTVQNNLYVHSRLQLIQNKPLTADIYEGLTYVRQNTPKDALIASYRCLMAPDNPRYFYYSAFSERRMIIEGWSYLADERQAEAEERYEEIKRIYHTKKSSEAEKILRKYQIDYVIVDKTRRHRLRFPLDGLLAREFANEDMEVYQVVLPELLP